MITEEPLAEANRKRAASLDLNQCLAEPMWGLSDALALVRAIQPEIQKLGFHVCLAGGVLNRGTSEKDLDLVFVPLTNEKRPELAGICTWFVDKWDAPHDNVTDAIPCVSLRYQASYLLGCDKRIDVFVV